MMPTLHILTSTYASGRTITSSVGATGHIPHEVERLMMPIPVRVDVWHLQRGQVDRDVDWRLTETYQWS